MCRHIEGIIVPSFQDQIVQEEGMLKMKTICSLETPVTILSHIA